MRDLPDDNLSYPVLIKLDDGVTASGFYLNNKNQDYYFVTAKHVFFKIDQKTGKEILRSKKAHLTCYSRNLVANNSIEIILDFQELDDKEFMKVHLKADVVVVKIADIIDKGGPPYILKWVKGVSRKTKPNNYPLVAVARESFKKYKDVLISNKVFVFGYPNSLGLKKEPQIDYSKPLLRKGIVAGKNDSLKTIILDCPVYYGNSGGLAIEVEFIPPNKTEFRSIGIVSQFVPFVEQWVSLQHNHMNTQIENSGYSIVIPIDTIIDLID